jgi:hypothetical protein
MRLASLLALCLLAGAPASGAEDEKPRPQRPVPRPGLRPSGGIRTVGAGPSAAPVLRAPQQKPAAPAGGPAAEPPVLPKPAPPGGDGGRPAEGEKSRRAEGEKSRPAEGEKPRPAAPADACADAACYWTATGDALQPWRCVERCPAGTRAEPVDMPPPAELGPGRKSCGCFAR